MKGCFPLGPDLSRPSIPIQEYIKCWPTGNPTSQLWLPLPRPQRVRARALPWLERRQTLAFPPPFTKIFHHHQPHLARLPQIATSPGSHFSQIDPNLHSRRLAPREDPAPIQQAAPGADADDFALVDQKKDAKKCVAARALCVQWCPSRIAAPPPLRCGPRSFRDADLSRPPPQLRRGPRNFPDADPSMPPPPHRPDRRQIPNFDTNQDAGRIPTSSPTRMLPPLHPVEER